ncbi:MAG: metal ABC transporter permease [Hyphomicrobiales bacterium]|nr:metal ABC transporter permease [Hyphomicrobiales bacterium]
MHDLFIAPFADFAFMRRALVGAVALSLSGAPLGVFLILRRMSLSGDAMAHAILPGAAIGYLVAGLSLPAMTIGGLAAGLVVAFGAGLAARATSLREDASLAAFYLVSLALGVTLVSLRGSNIDLLHVLFGNVLALDDSALMLLSAIASLTLLALALLYRPLVLDTVDPAFLATTTRAGSATQIAFLGVLVLNLVAGFHALGTLMSVGLMMLPAASARLWARRLETTLALAALFAVLAAYIGLVASYRLATPSGPSIVLAAGAIYFLSLIFGASGGALRHFAPRRHLEA